MESFSATRNTTGFGRKENNPGLAATFVFSPQALAFFVQREWDRALLVPIDAKLVPCHGIGAHKPRASSKEGSQARH